MLKDWIRCANTTGEQCLRLRSFFATLLQLWSAAGLLLFFGCRHRLSGLRLLVRCCLSRCEAIEKHHVEFSKGIAISCCHLSARDTRPLSSMPKPLRPLLPWTQKKHICSGFSNTRNLCSKLWPGWKSDFGLFRMSLVVIVRAPFVFIAPCLKEYHFYFCLWNQKPAVFMFPGS